MSWCQYEYKLQIYSQSQWISNISYLPLKVPINTTGGRQLSGEDPFPIFTSYKSILKLKISKKKRREKIYTLLFHTNFFFGKFR